MEEKKVRIGRLSMGILLILIGIGLIVGIFNGTAGLNILLKLWPIILISLGIETLYYNFKKNVKATYDVWCVIVLTFLIIISTGIYAANYVVKEALGEGKLGIEISDVIKAKTYHFYMDKNEVNVENFSSIAKIDVVTSKTLDMPRIVVTYKTKSIFTDTYYDTFIADDSNLVILKDSDNKLDELTVTIYVNENTKTNIIGK